MDEIGLSHSNQKRQKTDFQGKEGQHREQVPPWKSKQAPPVRGVSLKPSRSTSSSRQGALAGLPLPRGRGLLKQGEVLKRGVRLETGRGAEEKTVRMPGFAGACTGPAADQGWTWGLRVPPSSQGHWALEEAVGEA